MDRIRTLTILLLLTAAAACSLFAQSDRGIITGTVKDISGAVIPGARVTALNTATNVKYTTTTTETGDYTIPSIPVGNYNVLVEREGFKQGVHEKIELAAGTTARIDTVLQVGATQDSVVVSADVQQLQTESARVASQVATKLIDELPLVVGGEMRNPFNLATTTPQVNGSGDNLRIGGGQQGAWGILLDGTSSNTNRGGNTGWSSMNTPSVEAITEFNVESNGFKAEFGRAGGGVITFVSKSGTNQVHGSLYDFMRNDALDARGFFNLTKPVYKQHDFGVSLGGPVWVPKVYDGRNKTFFFFAYEGFRNRVGAGSTPRAIPPAEFYDGDFRNLVNRTKLPDGTYQQITVYDPATTRYDNATKKWMRDPFPNNMVPQGRFDSFTQKLLPLARAVKSNRPGLVPGSPEYVYENYLQSGFTLNPSDKMSVKVDHMLSNSHRLAFFYNSNAKDQVPGPNGPPGMPGDLLDWNGLHDKSKVYRGSWDATLSPQMLNRFYFGLNRFYDFNIGIQEGQGGWKNKGFCLPNVPDCDFNLLRVGTGEFGTWGSYGRNGSENPTFTFNDDLTWVRGKHTFKGGYMYEMSPYNGFGLQNASGQVNFDRLSTSVPQDTNASTGGGSGFAAMLLGNAYSGTVTTPRFVAMRWRYQAMYFQDDWRITDRLTLNLGVRYEFNLPPLEDNDHWSDFSPTTPNPGADGRLGALVFAGFGPGRQNSRTLVPGWYGGIGPRVGLAYALDKKTVLRASATRSFGPVKTTTGTAHFQGYVLIQDFPNVTQGVDPLFQFSAGMPAWTPPPMIKPEFANNTDVYWWQGQESSRLPEDLGYSFTIQRQVSPTWIVEAGYSAIVSSHLVAGILKYNQIDMSTLPAGLSPYTADGRDLLRRKINDPKVIAAGIRKPFTNFPDSNSVEWSLRPYPQYNNINTQAGGGDHSGHSTYHSALFKATKRFSQGLVFNASYVLSKQFSNAETYGQAAGAMDQYNRGLDKAVVSYDKTHEAKINYVYELPFGKGKSFLTDGLASKVVGGWRVGAIHYYSVGTPLSLGGAYSFPGIGNRPTVTTYEGWKNTSFQGSAFDPYADSYMQPKSYWPSQATITDRLGNMTKTNPKFRSEPSFNESISVARTFRFGEALRMDFRWEAFNLFNRVRWGDPTTDLNSVNFGLVRGQGNTPRNMQFGLKIYW